VPSIFKVMRVALGIKHSSVAFSQAQGLYYSKGGNEG
jgi:hypothetical protein